MVIKTFPTKLNTIVYNSTINTGKNPVCELYYGDGYSRILIYFDTTKITSLVNNKTFTDITKLKHVLKLNNCWGIQSEAHNVLFNSGKDTPKERTSSFDIQLIRLPEPFDSGSGNDFTIDNFLTKTSVLSTNASNWFNSTTESPWLEGNGAISATTVNNTIATQHFDYGNEDIEIDITNEINSIISGGTNNYGFLLKFPDLLENTATEYVQYVGFFTQNSNLGIFNPNIETTYDNKISDDRNNFYLDKNNKLYFYSIIGGKLTNLDILPTCNVEASPYAVKQATVRVYYVEVNLSTADYQPNTMLYDIWSNIVYNGVTFNDVELDFVTKANTEYFNFGNNVKLEPKRYIPNVYGINNGQKLNLNSDVIKLGVQVREQYVTNKNIITDSVQYRIYSKSGEKEITVIDYNNVEKTATDMYFMLDIESLSVNKYFIDLKVNIGDEIITHKNILHFEIVSEVV